MDFLLVAALVAVTASGTPATVPPANAGDKDQIGTPNEVICKKTAQAGTRLRAKRICRTKAEWDQLETDTRDALRNGARRGTSGQ